MPFPPTPVYPKAIDSDYTLYLVYNTTETRLSADNSPWAQEISIVPVGAGINEIWADNGFGNIEGELFYYDSVSKDANGKVNKLKGCARQIGGEKTRFNKKGTWIRSYVVAEHHNQLVEGILKTEDFIGRNFDTRQETLDWRIRNLQELEVIFDDFSCPDINFTFNIIENSPVSGVLAQYIVEITPPGSINNFRLDFGDGESTTTDLSGEHRYALNARIDPIVSVSNDKCQIIQTPVERDNPAEPQPEVEEVFDFPVPEFPDVPDFNQVPCEVPEPDINLPPFAYPCGISIEGQIGPLPSVITGPDINLVSQVTITSNNPINITQSVVSIIGGNIPSLIIIDPPIPPTIIIDPPIPPTIVIVPPQSNITLDFDFAEMPRLEVDWGNIPQMEVALTMAKEVKTPKTFSNDPTLVNEFGKEFADLFNINETMKVEYESVGIPSEIKVIFPEDGIKINTDDLFSREIKLDASSVNIPSSIQIFGPESPIPNSIRLDATELPPEIDLVYKGDGIKIDASELPKSIKLEIENKIPDRIVVEMPKPIPNTIVIEHNLPDRIFLEGPSAIPLILPEDFFLPIRFPEKMPELEVVLKANPIEVKISMDEIIQKAEDGRQCVMIVPCNK